MKMKLDNPIPNTLYILSALFLCSSCSGEDRSGEQPFAPTVNTQPCSVQENRCIMQGYITASPNSTIKECGFHYGNDTVQWEIKAELIYPEFSVTVDSLDLGEYYAVAYARNGIGTSYGDTVNFRITSAE